MSNLVGIVWFPHSGCRWLNRSLLGKHSKFVNTELFLPFITHTTDMILNLDRSSQVHKTRSLPELKTDFDVARMSVEYGRKQGIKKYIDLKLGQISDDEILTGAISPGAPEPLVPDLDVIIDVFPDIKIIHLIRNPIDCYLSMKSRSEMDGDVYKIAPLWSGFNSYVRNFGIKHSDNYLLLRYEDLKENTNVKLKEICSWINVDFEDNMIIDANQYYGKNKGIDLRKKLSIEEESSLGELTQVEATNYGY